MKLSYQLTEEDYRAYYLFIFSNSNAMKKTKALLRYAIPLIFTIIGISLFIITHTRITALLCFVIALLWVFLYPTYSKKSQRNILVKLIHENHKHLLNVNQTLSLNEDQLILSDPGSETRIKPSELEELIETTDYYFLKTKSAGIIFLPKNTIRDQSTLKSMIAFLKNDLKISFHLKKN